MNSVFAGSWTGGGMLAPAGWQRGPARLARLFWLAPLLALAACPLPAAVTPSAPACRDRCDAMSCPAGTYCMVTSDCTAFCQQQQFSR